jgi:V/A-type H+/Na+-transporting ATPase subunit E
MGLESIVDDIRDKGRRETDAIRSDTSAQVNLILQAAQKRVEEIKLEAERDVEGQMVKIQEQEISAANLIVKRQVLNAQKELLDQAYQATLASLSALPESFHRDLIRKLLLQAADEIKSGSVSCNKRDTKVVQDLIAQDKGLAGYCIGDAIEIEGGIVVQNSEGDVKLDLSYRTFLEGMWESGLKDASDILFA